jgi:hypothetical protein
MGRAELLFGEMASGLRTPNVSRHARPDGTLPLRMQGGGRGPARARIVRWQIALWKRALRSRAGWRRGLMVAMVAAGVQMVVRTPPARVVVLAAMFGAVAWFAGAWAEVAMVGDGFEVGRN